MQLKLDQIETQILRQLTAEYREVLSGRRADRGDPLYDRLFPSAYEDPSEEGRYRELIGDSLEKHKLEALDKVVAALGPRTTDVTIEDEDFDAWLQTLTDLRLAIGTRLGVDEEKMSTDVDAKDPDAQAMSVLHWLGWLQERLLSSIQR